MIFQVLKATIEESSKNDFVQTCKKYMKELKINLSFEQIASVSKPAFKKLLQEKSKSAAFKYLMQEKSKQSKILNIKYSKLEIQEYLLRGDRNVNVQKFIFKARSKTLDLKLQKKWKYEDLLCSGCHDNEESGEEIFSCKSFGENYEKITYSWFYSEKLDEQVSAAKMMMRKMKIRKGLRDRIT